MVDMIRDISGEWFRPITGYWDERERESGNSALIWGFSTTRPLSVDNNGLSEGDLPLEM